LTGAVLALALGIAPASPSAATEDLLIADFEGETYGNWKTTGEAFGPGPARGTLPGQMPVDGYKGKGLVNSFYKGDASTGTLTSPAFKIERKYIAFLIGGGKDPDKLAMNLLVDGKVVRTATGPNDKAGGRETLAPASWEVSDLVGKTAVIQIVDFATGGWGHINVDHIVQTNRKPPGFLTNARREFRIERRYLNLPIKNGATQRVVTVLVDNKPVVRNDIELADHEPDWWAPLDVTAWKGKTITLQVDKLPEGSTALNAVEPSDAIKGSENLYREPLRGQFHFSAKRGWNNDPNGLVYFQGEYHLFFQHNPYGWSWGNMHWGHAVSKDLVHWQELGDVLAPDALGPMFSGSAVVDRDNTSGFGKVGKAPLVLIYTAAGNPTTQCLAYSLDGRTFTKYQNNPVLKQITAGNRDPKVIWHSGTKRWVMVLYVELHKRHTVHFFTSPNLRDWTLASIVEGGPAGKSGYLFECPDFFALPLDGDVNNRKWILMGANTEYAVGAFDGTRFTPEHSKLPGHRGKGFYAPQTFSDIPASDGRRIQIGWFQTPTPGMPFNQSMSIPMQLKLITTADGPRLTWTPVKELRTLRVRRQESAATLQEGLIELRAEFESRAGSEVKIGVRGATITYDPRKQELAVNGHRAAAPLRNGKQRLTIYCDRSGLEVFAAEGLVFVPMPFSPKAGDLDISLSSGLSGQGAVFTVFRSYTLGSAWNNETKLSP
jgi:sucrose-6-phosphate hydrolase SacC (GH32 family)